MGIVKLQNFMVFFLATSASVELNGNGRFLRSPKVQTDAIQSALKAQTDAVQNELTAILSDVLGHGHGVTEDRLQLINATLLPIFRALPKNNRGHVSEPLMRYGLRRYFRASHGWILKGFESEHSDEDVFNATNSDNESSVSSVDILHSKVPGFARSALEQKFSHQGFSLHDMVSMIAALESLTFTEVVSSVENSHRLNSLESGTILSEAELHDVLAAFLVTEMLEGENGYKPTVDQYAKFKANPYVIYSNWPIVRAFLKDISGNDVFGSRSISNPFTVKTFAFGDVVRMAERITEEYASWSKADVYHASCNEMKKTMFAMDVHETGRVKLSDFYQATRDGAWLFTEHSAYLRRLGALDESSEHLGPQVIIPNYIGGMSNCITSSLYFSVCCPNDCDLIYQHIESEIPDPKGTVSQILEAVESFSTFPVVSQRMMNQLEEIATIGGGSIPLHGRLFAQWLHFAMPRQCPYPHAVGSISPRVPLPSNLETRPASEDEMDQAIKHATASLDPSPDAGTGMWELHENIMDFSTPSDTEDANRHAEFSKVLRQGSQIVMIGSFAALFLWEGIKMFRTFKGDAKQKDHTV